MPSQNAVSFSFEADVVNTAFLTHLLADQLPEPLSDSGHDQLPNVDISKHLESYLAPFVNDLGFLNVFRHVTSYESVTAIHQLSCIPKGLRAAGDAIHVVASIKQLVLTSQRRENLYIVAIQRRAYPAAFSSHILGMAGELLLGDVPTLKGYTLLPTRVECKAHPVEAPKTPGGHVEMAIDYALANVVFM
ncbi:hypothetical protein MKZ38_003681 [Zalerion maritima]|uniref:Uncharacterized protein n=1 Tax=Zalerion maritima TaxID=339359 RepID=A0AAD5WQ28_9PEZI|nr:hypothetical protein MKZ38_003681 [Zalerion maritima]